MKFRDLVPATKRGKTVAAIGLLLLVWYLCCLPRELFRVPYATVVADRHNALLGARIAIDGQWRFPPRSTVPPKVEACLIAFEDHRFRSHWGVDLLAIGRATQQNLKAKRIVSGGSTLTMQTIRLARGNTDRNIGEKLIEMIWATRLEFSHSKEKILALYVSHAPFGGNVVGLDAAAWRYFAHSAEALSWAEAAMLAVLPNAPAMIHLTKGRQTLLRKRNRLLGELYKQGTIDQSTYELALAEPLAQEPRPLPQTAPHLVDRYYQTQQGAYHQSTIDRELQLQVEAVVERWNREFMRSDIRNLAVVVADVAQGEVLVYCGNTHLNKQLSGNQVDVIRSPRSTGSILKPFLYSAMLSEGALLPNTLVADIPMNINGFTPQNFNQQFEGAAPASQAIARSLNIPTVSMLQHYGVPKFYSYLKRLGLTTLTKPASHYGLSLILGGAEATLWEVTEAYRKVAASLLPEASVTMHTVLHQTEEEDERNHLKVHSDRDANTNRHAAIDRGAAYQTLLTLREVNRPDEIDWRLLSSMQPIAWKTGTSYGFRDAWAVGITPRYVVGVWVGNATGEGKPGLVGARTAGPVLFDIFNLLPPSAWFAQPAGVFIDAEVCRLSGHLKGRFCEETDTMLILPAGLKTETCPYHHAVTLSSDEAFRLYENCARTESTVQKSWFTLPPVQEWYYKQQHPEYRQLPPFKPGCGEDNHQPMQFIYPPANARIRMPKQLDGTAGQLTVELVHTHPHATIYWHLDDTYLMQTADFHNVSLLPTRGKHSLTAVDEAGNTLSTTFYIE
ncbi:penicillin-binding protein 1C [Bacteroides sp.]|uniref:penicillin-binding protein 1C n=2 Tax=Bacteroides sp. TaxID=29523 RepID=UPI001B69E48E|nr:penicillin-binding protein 1C [Bacteroides sp.]MBP6066235.1 penicillin-binding protein 1C [Bacteroides sp.]MBP6066894.1 penicillin-binding protein 1C [Bacteroides sp.]MBP6936645.1 penicillin-binding protein 1C [Bacteroides sp.]MBP8621973.1 penicillin-binding protein 1C [Bacteroides sp.]